MDIGSKLQKARLEANLTLENIADQLGVSRQTISNWENGSGSPDISNLSALSEVLDVSVDELLKGELCGTENMETNNNSSKYGYQKEMTSE